MTLFEDLTRLLPPRQVSQGASVLDQHGRDESWHPAHRPDVVVFAESTADVIAVMAYAHQNAVPVIPFGVGSSLEGHVIPIHGGISLDMMRMNQILDICPEDFLVRVQPGVTRVQLNDALRRYGLFFPVDPGANASLGGMASTNASGTTTVRYGAMRDNVRSLEVVLPDATVIQAGTRAAKSSSGYNLTGLFVGSEGTLGVFTELWLKVQGIPERIVAARAQFPDVAHCVDASAAIVGAGLAVSRIEFVDERYIRAVNRFKGTAYPEVPTLFLEFHGNQSGVQREIELAREAATEHGCTEFVFEVDEKSRNLLWEVRHSAVHSFMAQYPGYGHMSTDVCVPLSKLPAALKHARAAIDQSGIHGALIGHVGDGNYHASLAIDRDDPDEMARALQLNADIVDFALQVGGTCTGEHGVGLGKRKYQAREHGPAIALMRAIKATIDPQRIMNPGKLVD